MNTLSSLLKFIGDTMGAAPSTLTTTAKTLVGAINEVDSDIDDVESSLKTLVLTKTGVSGSGAFTSIFTDSRITGDHVCPPGNAYLSNPSAQTNEWTVTTESGKATVSGSIDGTTDITLYLELKA